MKTAWMAVTLGVVLLCSACSDSAATSATEGKTSVGVGAGAAGGVAAAAADGKAVASINALCPIMGEAVEPDGGTAQFAGQTIGFCCAKCSGKFAKLDDAGKLDELAKHGTTLPQ